MGKNNSISARPSTGPKWAHLWLNLYDCLLDRYWLLQLMVRVFLNVFRCLELISSNSFKQPSNHHMLCTNILCLPLLLFNLLEKSYPELLCGNVWVLHMRGDFWKRWCSEMHPMCYQQTWLQFDPHQSLVSCPVSIDARHHLITSFVS